MSGLPPARLALAAVVALGAVLLAISELMVTFAFEAPGGAILREATAADRHGYAMPILAVGALVALVIALRDGSRPAAYALAAAGVLALALFLVIDLPDAGRVGDLEDAMLGTVGARAVPQAGFWLEACGAVLLGLGGVAFAALAAPYQR